MTQQCNLLELLKYAEQRTELQFTNIEKTINEIKIEFKNVSDNDIKKAIRNGGLAKYGRTYKLSTQEVCFWIREYLKEKPKPLKI